MKLFVIALGAGLCFFGCSDYAQNIDDNYQAWLKAQAGASSVVKSSSSSVAVCTNTYGTNTVTDCRDGQTYRTVVIGTQTWMAENLNYAVDSSWCYTNSVDSCAKYGRLYQWASAMGLSAIYNSTSASGEISTPHQGACPAGWHIPTKAEWSTLENSVGGSSTAGTYLKATSGWYDRWDYDGNGTDAYGFSALPGGYYDGSDFYSVGDYGNWWTATEYSSTSAYYRHMVYSNTGVYASSNYKTYGRSLRCLKD